MASLVSNTGSLDFGDVIVGQTGTLTITWKNVGSNPVQVLQINGPSTADFGLTSPVLPLTVVPGASFSFPVTYTPSGVGPSAADTFELVGTFINSPQVVILNGNGVAGGVPILAVDPPEWTFPATKVGGSSDEKLFTVINNGDAVLTISGYNLPPDFVLGPTNPPPPISLNPGDTYQFGIIFQPIAGGYVDQEDFGVVSDDPNSPFNIKCSGQAYLVDSVFPVEAEGPEWFLVAAVNGAAVTGVRRNLLGADPDNEADLDCEEDCQLQKIHNFNRIAEDKTVKYFWFHYEDLGACEVLITLANQQTGAVEVYTRNIGGGQLGRVLVEFFEVTMEGENIRMEIQRLAGQGSLSVLDYGFKFLPSEEALGTLANPKTITPAYVMDNCPEWLIIAVDEGATPPQKVDITNWECESPASAKNGVLIPFATEQGIVPGFIREKQIMRIHFHYEDYGPAVVRITVGTMRGQSTTQDVAIGTVFANRCVKDGVADLVVTDEVIEITFEKVSGPVSIIDYTTQYEVKGERNKAVETVDSLVGCDPPLAIPACGGVEPLMGGACPSSDPQLGTSYSSTLVTTGGVAPVTFSVVSGSLPPGITLNPSTGELSGIPTSAGTYNWVIRATDAASQTVDFTCTSEVQGEGSVVTTGWVMEEDSDYVYTTTLNYSVLRVQRIKKSDLSVTTFETSLLDNISGGVAIQQDTDYVYVFCWNKTTHDSKIVRIAKADFATYDIFDVSPGDRPVSYDSLLLDGSVFYCELLTNSANRLKIVKLDKTSFAILDTFNYDDFITYGFNPPITTALGIDDSFLYFASNPQVEGAVLYKLDKADFSGGPIALFQNDGVTNLGIAGGNAVIVDGDSIFLGLAISGSSVRMGRFSIGGSVMTALDLSPYTPTPPLTSLLNRRRLQGGLLLVAINVFLESGNPVVMVEIDPSTFTVTATQNLTAVLASAFRDFTLDGAFFYLLQCSDYVIQAVNSNVYKVVKA